MNRLGQLPSLGNVPSCVDICTLLFVNTIFKCEEMNVTKWMNNGRYKKN